MATIDSNDLSAVLAKMAQGEFICIFVSKEDGTPGDVDEVVTYPTDCVPMPAVDVVVSLSGFLAQCPVPKDETVEQFQAPRLDPVTGDPILNGEGEEIFETRERYVNRDAEGAALPKHSNLEWLARYIRDLIESQSTRGLQVPIANPMPE